MRAVFSSALSQTRFRRLIQLRNLARNLPDFALDSAPEATVAPESGRRPLRKKGKTATPAASVQPKVPENLLEALNGASIEEEHRTVMSAVIQKVQLAKSGLTEACSSLLPGFEVRISIYLKWYRIDSSP